MIRRAFAFSCMLAALWLGLGRAAPAAQLLMFSEDGCPWCAAFKREVLPIYPKTDEAKVAPLKIVNVARIPKQYRRFGPIVYTPTFVLLDDDGRMVGRIEGYPGFDFFWARLDRMLEKLPKSKRPQPQRNADGENDAPRPEG